MIHPTRTNLLMLKEKSASVANSIAILRSRRQALIIEFLETSNPYLESRRMMRKLYGDAISQLLLSIGQTGEEMIASLASVAARDFTIEISRRKLWGLEFKEIAPRETAVRPVDKRNYDCRFPPACLDEAAWRFEKLVDVILDNAEYDNKLQRLSREIIQTTRRLRVLEERILPRLKTEVRTITQYLGERERETYYRLKQFKEIKYARL